MSGKFLKAVERAADGTWGPVNFVPVHRRTKVGRLDRTANPAIAGHLVTTLDLFSANRSAFVQRPRRNDRPGGVLAELDVEAAAIAGHQARGCGQNSLDLEVFELAVETARAAGLTERGVEACALHCGGLGPAGIGQQPGSE